MTASHVEVGPGLVPPGPTATSGSEVKDSSQDILENHSPSPTKGSKQAFPA